MPFKSCPNCNQTSYSASDSGVWYCPYCGNDITFVKGLAIQPDQGVRIKEDENDKEKNMVINYLRFLPRQDIK